MGAPPQAPPAHEVSGDPRSRSRALLDARAAGITYPLMASWFDVGDRDGLIADAQGAVVATGDATTRLDDGQVVTVDGAAGTIHSPQNEQAHR